MKSILACYAILFALALGLAPLRVAAQPAKEATETGKILFINDCEQPVIVAVKYKTIEGSWETRGWWDIAGNERVFLQFEGEPLRTDHQTIYLLAETTEGPDVVWTGDHQNTIDNLNFGFLETSLMKIRDGNFDIAIECGQ